MVSQINSEGRSVMGLTGPSCVTPVVQMPTPLQERQGFLPLAEHKTFENMTEREGIGTEPEARGIFAAQCRDAARILLAGAQNAAKTGHIELLSRAVPELIDHPPQSIRSPYFSHRCYVSFHDTVDIGIVASHPVSIFKRSDLGESATHQQIDGIRSLGAGRSWEMLSRERRFVRDDLEQATGSCALDLMLVKIRNSPSTGFVRA